MKKRNSLRFRKRRITDGCNSTFSMSKLQYPCTYTILGTFVQDNIKPSHNVVEQGTPFKNGSDISEQHSLGQTVRGGMGVAAFPRS